MATKKALMKEAMDEAEYQSYLGVPLTDGAKAIKSRNLQEAFSNVLNNSLTKENGETVSVMDELAMRSVAYVMENPDPKNVKALKDLAEGESGNEINVSIIDASLMALSVKKKEESDA